MPVQTFEAIVDGEGNVRFVDAVRLPAHTKVYVVIPEQSTPYSEIVPDVNAAPSSSIRIPLVRVRDEGLAKRLVKTIVADSHAEL